MKTHALIRDSAKTSRDPIDGQGMKTAPTNPITERSVKVKPSLISPREIKAAPKTRIENPERMKNSRETNRCG